MIKEFQVKKALVTWLTSKGLLENHLIVSEMVVGDWARRADLVVLGAQIQAFEIKTEFDTLKRLDGQLKEFSCRFDKVTIVCSDRFTQNILSIDEYKNFSVIEYFEKNNNISFKVRQRGRVNKVSDKNILIEYLNKSDMAEYVRRLKKFDDVSCLSKNELINILELQPLTKLREFIYSNLISRYKTKSRDFLSSLYVTNETSSERPNQIDSGHAFNVNQIKIDYRLLKDVNGLDDSIVMPEFVLSKRKQVKCA